MEAYIERLRSAGSEFSDTDTRTKSRRAALLPGTVENGTTLMPVHSKRNHSGPEKAVWTSFVEKVIIKQIKHCSSNGMPLVDRVAFKTK